MKYHEVSRKVWELTNERLELLKAFLRENGWKHTCAGNPGAQWLWEREWEGKRWTYDTAEAAFDAHRRMFWQELEAEEPEDEEDGG
jgi:hypothetical protein